MAEKKEIKFPYDSKIPAFNTLARAFDLLADTKKLDALLENISEEERDFLYNHPIMNEIEGLLP